MKRRERCVRGHPLRGPGADVLLNDSGQVRVCRPCNREREYVRRRHGAVLVIEPSGRVGLSLLLGNN